MFDGEVAPRSRTHSASCEAQTRVSSPRPLERRESFGLLCAGDAVWSGPDDVPRNSFMKSCAIVRPIFGNAVHVPQKRPSPEHTFRANAKIRAFRFVRGSNPEATAYFPSLLISTLPLRYAPSSMAIRCVAMSPMTTADLRSSTL